MPNSPRPSKPQGKGFKLRPLPEEPSVSSLENPAASSTDREPFDQLGDLPHGYGVDTIFLIAQEPHWLFTYWDIDIKRHPGGAAYLRYHLSDGTLEGEIEVPFETRNWYVPVQRAGADYFVEIGFYRGKTWNMIARSVVVTTPPEGMATSEAFDYATVPFHLSFQRMLDHLENARQSGEDLLTAVSRLQQNGDFSAFGTTGVPDLLTEDQRSLLRAMLGPDLLADLASGTRSSGEIEALSRAHLEEQLGSLGASERLSSFGADTSALFSGGGLSSATASASWEIGALSSWAAGALASWSGAGAASSGELTSWGTAARWNLAEFLTSAGGESSGASWGASLGSSWAENVLASWSQAGGASWMAGAESSGALLALASWLQGIGSSWSQGAQSSWLQDVQSSWATSALSSWNSAEVSSWFTAAATSSWSGGSDGLSSSAPPTEQGFYMNISAEVVFYGGTDRAAKVTIDGKPVTLSPDGTFRFHFVFPNSDYEIPIVAESPDGVEIRSATLRFSRPTNKAGLS